MRAIDTNIIVRYLTGDDPEQTARAKAVMEAGRVFASTTVILECEWVLRGVYKVPRQDVITALRTFLGLPNVTTDNPELVMKAFGYADLGVDFADALHLAAASNCESMYTFDRRFIKQAANIPMGVVEP